MTNLKTYLINLDDCKDRLLAAGRALSEAGVDFERLPAVDARGRPLADFPAYDEKSARRRYGETLRGGEIGCYLSHLKAAKKFLAGDSCYCLVLEDDVSVGPEFGDLLKQIISELKDHMSDEWELVNLGKATKAKYAEEIAEIAPGHWLEYSGVLPVTTHALLWNRKGAEAFVEIMGEKIDMPVDHGLAYHMTLRGSCFALNPPIVQQSDAESVIDAIEGRNNLETWPMRLAKYRRKWITGFVARRNLRRFRQTR